MITVAKAEQIILGVAKPLPIELCALAKACGRILREDIKSDRTQPPFNKSIMDGIAVASSAWNKGVRDFKIEATIAAGDPSANLKGKTSCVRIMTGAALPKNCDCIIPVEHVRVDGNRAYVNNKARVEPGQFVRPKGADAAKGAVLLPKGLRLSPPQIGIAASVGKTHIKVSKQPSIAIIATGNELIDIGKPIKPHQTRLSNSYALQSLFVQSGLAKADTFHLPDDKKILLSRIRQILSQYDILVLSGGVSMGEFDYTPQVLIAAGVTNLFHKIAQKPGKPFWFGISKTGKPVFALPGNPVSTLACAYRYVIPYLFKSAGAEIKKEYITIKQLPSIQSDLIHFLPVKNNVIVKGGGSGDFGGLANTDGFIEYDSKTQQLVRPYFSWRP